MTLLERIFIVLMLAMLAGCVTKTCGPTMLPAEVSAELHAHTQALKERNERLQREHDVLEVELAALKRRLDLQCLEYAVQRRKLELFGRRYAPLMHRNGTFFCAMPGPPPGWKPQPEEETTK